MSRLQQYKKTRLALLVIEGKRTLEDVARDFPSKKEYQQWKSQYYDRLLRVKADLSALGNSGQLFVVQISHAMSTVLGVMMHDIPQRQANSEVKYVYATTMEADMFTTLERNCYTLMSKKLRALGFRASVIGETFHIEADAKIWQQNAIEMLKMPKATLALAILGRFFAPSVINKLLEDF